MPMRILLITLLFVLIAKVNQTQEQETSGTFNNKFYVRIDTLPDSSLTYTPQALNTNCLCPPSFRCSQR